MTERPSERQTSQPTSRVTVKSIGCLSRTSGSSTRETLTEKLVAFVHDRSQKRLENVDWNVYNRVVAVRCVAAESGSIVANPSCPIHTHPAPRIPACSSGRKTQRTLQHTTWRGIQPPGLSRSRTKPLVSSRRAAPRRRAALEKANEKKLGRGIRGNESRLKKRSPEEVMSCRRRDADGRRLGDSSDQRTETRDVGCRFAPRLIAHHRLLGSSGRFGSFRSRAQWASSGELLSDMV